MNTDFSTRSVGQMGVVSSAIRGEHVEKVVTIVGRALVAFLFIAAGFAKIFHAKPYLDHMTRFDVPTFLLPAVIALELGAGLAILVGWRVRDAAGALAIFCVMTAVIFHHQLWISAELTSFFKDLAISGGLFVMAASSAARNHINSPVSG